MSPNLERIAAVVLASAIGAAAHAESAVRVGVLGAVGLTEASGMVASPRRDDVLWLVNDSGNTPALFALATDGRDLGSVLVQGADNHDWEDLAAFTRDGKSYLLIADVGDNAGRRETVALHAVEEPPIGEDGPPRTVPVAWTQRFRFPDGPQDCEAVAVDPRGPTVVLLSKRRSPPRLYSLPLGPPAQDVTVAEALGTVAFDGQPTALDIAADGRLAVLTYVRALVFASRASVAEALAAPPRVLPLPGGLRQAEALAFTRDGRLLVTSEGRGAPLVRFEPDPPAQPPVAGP